MLNRSIYDSIGPALPFWSRELKHYHAGRVFSRHSVCQGVEFSVEYVPSSPTIIAQCSSLVRVPCRKVDIMAYR